MATSAASETCGRVLKKSSTSLGYIFSPPVMYMSFARPTMYRKPSSSSLPTSPVFSQPSSVRISLVAASSLLGREELDKIWRHLWKCSLQDTVSPGGALSAASRILNSGSAVESEHLDNVMVRSLSRAPLGEEEKLALRAGMMSAPVGKADWDRCRRALRIGLPLDPDSPVRIPDANGHARFLAMCMSKGIETPFSLIPRMPAICEAYTLSLSAKEKFLDDVISHIDTADDRRAAWSALHATHSATDRIQVGVRIEERCPGTLAASDVADGNVAALTADEYASYLSIVMGGRRRNAAAVISRLSCVPDLNRRVLLMHNHVECTGEPPSLKEDNRIIQSLSVNEVLTATARAISSIDISTLELVETFVPYDLSGFRSLYALSRNTQGALPLPFVTRQTERVLPSLASGAPDSFTPGVAAAGGFRYEDGVALGNTLSRVAGHDKQTRLLTRILDDVPSRGRWVAAGFLDATRALLASITPSAGMERTVLELPCRFEEKYQPAFYGRLIRYVGDPGSALRDQLWQAAKKRWVLPAESPLKGAGALTSALSLLSPGEIPNAYACTIRDDLADILRRAEESSLIHLTGSLSLLLEHTGKWLSLVRTPLLNALRNVLDHFEVIGTRAPKQMIDDLTTGITELLKHPDGSAFLESACAGADQRWSALLVGLGARADDDNDLAHSALQLMETLIPVLWPGEDAASAWLDALPAGDDSDRSWILGQLAHPAAKAQHGDEWANILLRYLDGVEPDVEPEEREEALVYLRTPITFALAARHPEREPDRMLIVRKEEFERAWLCLRDSPMADDQEETAVDLLDMLMEADIALPGSHSSRAMAIDAASKVFENHPWQGTLADAALRHINTEDCITKRLNWALKIAAGLRSVAALRFALDTLLPQRVSNAFQSGNVKDIALAVSVSAAFQLRSLYRAADMPGIADDDDTIADLQRCAQAYRGVCSADVGYPLRRRRSELFLDAHVNWARDVAECIQFLGVDITIQELPLPYWTRIIRVARLSRNPAPLDTIARLWHTHGGDSVLPDDLKQETIACLCDYGKLPTFAGAYGSVSQLLLASGDTHAQLAMAQRAPSEIQEACGALSR